MYDRVYNRLSTDDCVDSNSRNCLICIDELVFRINPPPPPILRILKMLYMSLSHLFQEQILNLSSLTRTLSNSSVFYIFLKLEPGENRNLLFWSFSHFSKKCSQVSLKWVPCLGTMSWCLGTNETLASKHDIAKGQTKALSQRRPSWFFTIFSSFITAKGV